MTPKTEKVRFIFEVKGKGTEELAKKEVGDYIDVGDLWDTALK